MNKSTKLIALTFAAGAAGVALFSLANAPFTAALRGDVIVGIGASVAVLAFAAFDYSRPVRSLSRPARLLRPALPTTVRSASCEAEDNRKDRLAA